MKCHYCKAKYTRLETGHWGSGNDAGQLQFTPFICNTCGGLMLYEPQTGELHRLTAEQEALMLRNGAFREKVEERRAIIQRSATAKNAGQQ